MDASKGYNGLWFSTVQGANDVVNASVTAGWDKFGEIVAEKVVHVKGKASFGITA